MKQNPFYFSSLFFFFFFWIHIIPIFRKGRRKNILSCTYLWQGKFSASFLLRASGILQNLAECAFLLSFVQRFCSMLFYGDLLDFWLETGFFIRRLLSSNYRFFSKFPLTKRYHFGAKGSGQSFGFFLPPTISSGHATRVTCIPFFVQPIIGHGVQLAFNLHSDLDSLLCSTGCEDLIFVHLSLLVVSL